MGAPHLESFRLPSPQSFRDAKIGRRIQGGGRVENWIPPKTGTAVEDWRRAEKPEPQWLESFRLPSPPGFPGEKGWG